jgi:hypothetical protein
MKHTTCNTCNATTIPMSESIKIDGSVFCVNCYNAKFPYEHNLAGRKVEECFDSTVCAFCQKDNGTLDLPKKSKYPICDDCVKDINKRTFPNWVKAFFAGIIVIVVFSFAWNWKYYQAYNNIKLSNIAMAQNNFESAANLITAASEKVPEVADIKILESYYKGLDFMSKDKSTEALIEFNKCKNDLPEDYHMADLLLNARIGSCFDNKDYKGFLEASKENLARDTTVALSWACVGSAYACLYADKGQDSDKTLAINNLDKAKAKEKMNENIDNYYNMIEHRLYTRQIMTREVFNKQYPNGWTKN